MAKLTLKPGALKVDLETEGIVRRYAGKSDDAAVKWIAEAVRRRMENEWPPNVLKLFGSWKQESFPDADLLHDGYGQDAKREAL